MATKVPAGGGIVVGVDGSPASEHAVLWAAQEASLRDNALTLVHAQKQVGADDLTWLASVGIPSAQVKARIRANADRAVERAHSLVTDQYPGLLIESVIAEQDARRLLLDVGRTAEMTVVGTRGHGHMAGLLLGSVSAALVRHSQSPIAVIRPLRGHERGVLVGADGSEGSIDTIEQGYAEASLRQMPLTIVHCMWDNVLEQERWSVVSETDPGAERARAQVCTSIGGMRDKFPDVEMEMLLAQGAPDACLVDLSARYDLLVLGRPVRPLLLRLTSGSLTLPVVEHARSPVLVVP